MAKNKNKREGYKEGRINDEIEKRVEGRREEWTEERRWRR